MNFKILTLKNSYLIDLPLKVLICYKKNSYNIINIYKKINLKF